MIMRIKYGAVVVMMVLNGLTACPSGGGSAGNILPAGVVTQSEKRGVFSWYICVKADNDPKDTFQDGYVYCNAKETAERGERCPVGRRWPECGQKQN